MDEKRIIDVFNTRFTRGYVLKSDISRDQLADYLGLNSSSIDYDYVEQLIVNEGLNIGNERIMPIGSVIRPSDVDIIFDYLENKRETGCERISLLKVYDDLYNTVFIESRIDRGNYLLLKLLIDKLYPGKYEFDGEAIAFKQGDNVINEVVKVLILEDKPLTINEIKNKVQTLSSEDVDGIINHAKEFDIIKVDSKRYTLFDCFDFDQRFLDELAQLLLILFKDNDTLDDKDVYDELSVRLGPGSSLSMYGVDSPFCLANVIVHIYPNLKHCYGYLSKTTVQNRIVDGVMDEFLKHDIITQDIFDSVMEKYHRHQWCYFETILQEFVRINETTFVKKETIDFPTRLIDQTLAQIVNKGYCPITSITTFGDLPSITYPWNRYLLFSFIYSYSEQFEMIVSDSGIPRNFHAIIATKRKFNSLERVCAQFLIDSGFTMNQLDNDTFVGEYLKNNGYITRVRKGHQGAIISIAKSLRAGSNV